MLKKGDDMDDVSRRDLFAMAALQGLLAGPSMIKAESVAKYAYQIADAMIYESNKDFIRYGCPIDPTSDPSQTKPEDPIAP